MIPKMLVIFKTKTNNTMDYWYMTYKDLIPPHGTMTEPRLLTKWERKQKGRESYANYVASIILKALSYHNISKFSVRWNYYNMVVSISETEIKVQYFNDYKSWNWVHTYPFTAKSVYTSTVKTWLKDQDPCLNAKIVKTIDKIIRDKKSVEGMKKKQADEVKEVERVKMLEIPF